MKKLIKTTSNILLFYGLSFAQEPQWRIANGTEGVYISDIDIYDSNPDTLYATGQQFLISTDKGEHWDSVSVIARLSVIEIDPFDSKRIYLSHGMLPTDGTEVLMTTDGGINWESLFLAYTPHMSDNPIIETDPGDLNTVYIDVSSSRFYRSSDHGSTWDSIPSPDATGLSSLAISPSSNNILYAGYTGPAKIYKSTDRSQTWTQLPFPYYGGIISIAVHPVNPDIVYTAILAGDSRGVYKTTDGGQTWNQMNNGLDSLRGYDYLHAIVINPEESETLYLGVSSSHTNTQNPILFRSIDGANNWLPFDSGLPEYGSVRSIAIDTLNDRIYAGTISGIYIYDNILSSINAVDLPAPETFYLYQNYPNPFNPVTNIRFSLAAKHASLLQVYDITGRLVETLINEPLTPGDHKITWHASHLPSGVYFVRLQSGDFVQTKKMVLLR